MSTTVEYAKNATISQFPYATILSSHETTGQFLVSDQSKVESEHWARAIDQILKFKTDSGLLDPDDVPHEVVYQAAIDFAVDHKDFGTIAPSWIIPSGAGRITFEWDVGRSKFILEFVESGFAEYIEMSHGKVIGRGYMRRNPSSRKLELEI